MSIDFSSKAKAKQLRDFFSDNGRIYIVVDATADAVDVPEFLKGDPALRLVLNTRMPQPIYIRDDAVASVFSFSGQSHDCHIPLQHIWAAYHPDRDLESGLVWEDAVPEMIRAVIAAQQAPATIDPQTETVVTEEPTTDATPETKTNAPHLRVVK